MRALFYQIRWLLLRGAPLRCCALFFVCALLMQPVQTHALGFGALDLQSHLHMSMKADIPLLLHDSDEIKNVRIELASQQEYEQLGLQWQTDLRRLRVSIQDRRSGHPVLQLRSSGQIHSPMLSVLLKAKKSGRGTYFKHYKIFLDPAETPVYTKPTGLALSSLPRQQAEETNPTPAQNVNDAFLEFQNIDNMAVASTKDDTLWARTWRYGPVQAGDSLSEISYRLRVDQRYPHKQVMLSMYESNRSAFVDGNINHLIKGVWLTVPRAHVVDGFAGDKAALKLSRLLSRPNPNLASNNDSSPATTTDPAPLRYSGKISLSAGDGATVALNQGFDDRLEVVHQEMMAGKLQMTSLDQTVSALHVSMQGAQRDIQRLQQEVNILKTQSSNAMSDTEQLLQELKGLKNQGSGFVSDRFNMLLAGLVALVLLLLGIVIAVLKNNKSRDVAETQESVQAVVQPMDQAEGREMGTHSVEPTNQPKRVESEQRDREFEAMQKQVNQALSTGSIDSTDSRDVEIEDFALSTSQQPAFDEPEVQFQTLIEMGQDDHSNTLSLDEEILKPSADATPESDEMLQMLNQTEASLGQCDFEQAEKNLQKIAKQWPDSLKALALKAQLYHETDRLEERNELINSISDASDEKRWERFCYYLPSHVWNACFGETPAPGDKS